MHIFNFLYSVNFYRKRLSFLIEETTFPDTFVLRNVLLLEVLLVALSTLVTLATVREQSTLKCIGANVFSCAFPNFYN